MTSRRAAEIAFGCCLATAGLVLAAILLAGLAGRTLV